MVTYIRESKPRDDNSKGLVPMTAHMSAIVIAVEEVGFVMVASSAEAPMSRIRQNRMRKNHPEAFEKPWRTQTKIEARSAGE
jgi:hypothetical protein